MTKHRSRETPIGDTFEQYLRDKGKDDGETGTYRRNAKPQLEQFERWATGGVRDAANADPPESWAGITGEDGPVTFDDLNALVFSDYIRHLQSRGLAKTTIETYYAYISSWSKWAYREQYLESHYARQADAVKNLEEPDSRADRQAWDQTHRDTLTRYVDEQAEDALDAYYDVDVPDGEWGDLSSSAWQTKQTMRFRAIKAVRTRAFAFLLAYTGLRGAEFLRSPDDDRDGRRGLRWSDVDFTDRSVYVYRKNQEWKYAALPDPVLKPLENYQTRLDPPEEWPVFTTLHNPTLARHTTDALEKAGYSSERISELRDAKPDLLTLTDEELPAPPALSTDGGRAMMESLTEAAGIELGPDGVHDYLAPHGARRGMGEIMVRQFGFAEAARYLDNSEEQVREAYQHIEVTEQSDIASRGISETDNRVSYNEAPEED